MAKTFTGANASRLGDFARQCERVEKKSVKGLYCSLVVTRVSVALQVPGSTPYESEFSKI
jgi:hypothetical protein